MAFVKLDTLPSQSIKVLSDFVRKAFLHANKGDDQLRMTN